MVNPTTLSFQPRAADSLTHQPNKVDLKSGSALYVGNQADLWFRPRLGIGNQQVPPRVLVFRRAEHWQSDPQTAAARSSLLARYALFTRLALASSRSLYGVLPCSRLQARARQAAGTVPPGTKTRTTTCAGSRSGGSRSRSRTRWTCVRVRSSSRDTALTCSLVRVLSRQA